MNGDKQLSEMADSVIKRAVELHDPALARDALTEIETLLRRSPDPQQKLYLLFSRASCDAVLGEFSEAEKQLSCALQENPDDPDTQMTFEFLTGLLLQQRGNYAAAFEKLSSFVSGNAEKLKTPELRSIYEDAQERRASLAVTLGKFEEAIPLLKESLSFHPKPDGDTHARLGLSYMETHQYELAKQHFAQALAARVSTEWEGQSHLYLGIAQFYTHSIDDAKREFQLCEENAASYQISLLDVSEWLSAVHRELGETQESERYARLAKLN
jgi:tetratricopeptide (TPR) repeat protein